MIDQDLKRLAARDDRSLDRLEQDIWLREEQASARIRGSRQMMAWQCAVLVAAVISSASFGASQATVAHHRHGVVFAHTDLAPASLLMGGKE
jgi:hypothetical protein